MKKVMMFVVAALWVAIPGIASAQHSDHSSHGRQQRTGDALRAAVQEICPVSGEKLGAHGKPVKAKIGQEEVFLCCAGCVGGKTDAGHWATIHANLAKAQARCPVMDRPLPKNAKSTIVEGRAVYICCPPCAKKIAADPKQYVEKVDALYAASVKSKQDPR